MTAKFEIHNDKVIVTLEGKMYIEEATDVREKAIQYIDKGYKNFIFDMEKLEYIDSTGLGVLVAIHKRTVEKGGRIKIRKLRGNVKDIFEWTRMNKVFEIEE